MIRRRRATPQTTKPTTQVMHSRAPRRFWPSVMAMEERLLLSTIYVSSTRGIDTPAPGGVYVPSTAATPYRTIQQAINFAGSADDGDDTIEVAAGTYSQAGVDLGIAIPDSANISNLRIFGGYDDTATTPYATRNTDPSQTIYIPQNTVTNGNYDVQVRDSGTTIDGFTFAFDGQAGPGGTRQSGGILSATTNFTLNNNVIEMGVSGGGRAYGVQTLLNGDSAGLTVTNNAFIADMGTSASPSFSTAAEGIGLAVAPNGTGRVTIQGNTFTGSNLASGVLVNSDSGVDILENNFLRPADTPNYYFPLIDLRSASTANPLSDVTIQRNVIDGGNVSTAAGFNYGIWVGVDNTTNPISNISILNNFITGNGTGVLVSPAATNIKVNANSIADNSVSGLGNLGSNVVDASGNWWGSSAGPRTAENPNGTGDAINGNSDGTSDNSSNVDYTPWLNSGTDTDTTTPGFQGDYSSLTVTDNGGQTGSTGRIQEAVDLANAGGTVIVQSGTYTEQVTIPKSLTVTGQGASTTTIQAPATLVGGANGFRSLVTITGSGTNVDLGGFTITGPANTGPLVTNGTFIDAGVFVRDGANASIQDNTINNITGNNDGTGYAITVGHSSETNFPFDTTGTATIERNTISNYQKGGIIVAGAGSAATIQNGNTITGSSGVSPDGSTLPIAQNGIVIRTGAVGTVTGNTISGNQYSGGSSGADPYTAIQSIGVSLSGAGNGTLVQNNAIFGNDIGIYSSIVAGGTATLDGNQIGVAGANRYEGIFLDQGTTNVTNNTIKGGNIGVAAISYVGNDADTVGTLNHNIISSTLAILAGLESGSTQTVVLTANNNDLSGSTDGVDSAKHYTTATSTVAAGTNDFANGPVVDASDNYWGTTDGDTVKAKANNGVNVDYSPYQAAAFSNDTLFVVADGAEVGSIGRIQEGVNLVNPGGSVAVGRGTFVGQVLINKSLILAGSGRNDTAIVAPQTLVDNGTGLRNIVTVTGTGTNARISDFTITGPAINGPLVPNDGTFIDTGVFVRDGAIANITNNAITNITGNNDGTGYGVLVGRGPLNTAGTATIFNNAISNYQKGGIYVDGAGSSATIDANQITGSGPAINNQRLLIAQNGIVVFRGATATIGVNNGNVISNNQYADQSADGANSVGIYLYEAGSGTIVANNTSTANDNGIEVYNTTAGNSATFTNNTITGSGYGNGRTSTGIVVNTPGTVAITGATINSANIGIDVHQSGRVEASNVQITGGSIGVNAVSTDGNVAVFLGATTITNAAIGINIDSTQNGSETGFSAFVKTRPALGNLPATTVTNTDNNAHGAVITGAMATLITTVNPTLAEPTMPTTATNNDGTYSATFTFQGSDNITSGNDLVYQYQVGSGAFMTANGTYDPDSDTYTFTVSGLVNQQMVTTRTMDQGGLFSNTITDTVSNSNARVHDTTSGQNFDTIQAAIDAAMAGDTIRVDSNQGTFAEQLSITKNLVIMATSGMAKPTIVSPLGATGGSLISINADVTLDGFIINSSTTDGGYAAITQGGSASLTLQNSDITSGFRGLISGSVGHLSILNDTFTSVFTNDPSNNTPLTPSSAIEISRGSTDNTPVTITGTTITTNGGNFGINISAQVNPVLVNLTTTTITGASSAGINIDATTFPVTVTVLDNATMVTNSAHGVTLAGTATLNLFSPPTLTEPSNSPVITNNSDGTFNATFTFAGADNITSGNDLVYSYQLDNNPVVSSTSSPLTLSNLSQGQHTIKLMVTNQGGKTTTITQTFSNSPVVNNFSFETPALGAGNFQYNPDMASWTFTGLAGISNNGSAFTSSNPPAPGGTQVAFVQKDGSFTQMVNFAAAGNYTINFLAAQRGNFNSSTQNFQVLIDGNPVGTFTPSSASYQNFSSTVFQVDAGAHSITFTGLNSNGGDNTAFIDNVSVAIITAPVINTQLQNGGFETPDVPAGGFQYDPDGASWTFLGLAGISDNGSAFTSGNPSAPEGSQVAFVQNDGSFTQSVNFAAAGNYTINFLAAQRGNFNSSTQNFQVFIDGTSVGTFTPSSASYQNFSSMVFAAGAGAHSITFTGLNSNGGDNTAFIDNITLDVANPVVGTQVKDGSFETPQVGNGQLAYSPTGSDWNFAQFSGLASNNSGFTSGNPPAPSGTQVAFLQILGEFSQSVTFDADSQYTINFLAAQRGNNGLSTQRVEVLVDGISLGIFVPANTSYQSFITTSFNVTAGTSRVITFRGVNANGDNTAFIDSVSLTPIQ